MLVFTSVDRQRVVVHPFGWYIDSLVCFVIAGTGLHILKVSGLVSAVVRELVLRV